MNDDAMPASNEEWKNKLDPETYRVMREGATEAPFTGQYVERKGDGMYRCKACGSELFDTDTQFTSKTPGLAGWPSFSEAKPGAIEFKEDTSLGMHRTEIVCAKCGGHLGHLFDEPHDGTEHTSKSGKHFCVNSCALDFDEKET